MNLASVPYPEPQTLADQMTGPSHHQKNYRRNAQLEDQVRELKRNNEYEKAIVVLSAWVEQEVANIPTIGYVASFPFLELAKIYNKLKRYAEEVAICEHFITFPSSGSKQSQQLLERLPKAYKKAPQLSKSDDHPLFVKHALLVDTETTGLSNQDEVIELALLLFRYSTLTGRIIEKVDEYVGLREPSAPIQKMAQSKHGLQAKDVAGHVLDSNKIKRLFNQADILIAHNASFDRRMLSTLYPEVESARWYCTMNGIDWAANGCESKSLENILNHLELSISKAHRAMNDVKAIFALLSMPNTTNGQIFMKELLFQI
jgi:DNA polymerase III epsilon subunit-like protein